MGTRFFLPNLLILLCCSLFLITQVHICTAQTPQQIAKKAFESTVLLVMEDARGQPLSIASGFFVQGGAIATNLHVIQGASRGYIMVVGQSRKYILEAIAGTDPDRDLILLTISRENYSPLFLGNSDAVEVGEPVYAVGNPQGLQGTFSHGIVSGIRSVGSDRVLQITAPISPGSSGGPVLNSKGEVIGVSVATFIGGQNLNFAIPSNYLKTLLAKKNLPKPLASFKTSGKQRSIMASLGGRSTEGVVGEQLTWGHRSMRGWALPGDGEYTFSLRNRLRESVKNISCLVIFYDSKGGPIDMDLIQYQGIIPAGLAKRVKGKVDGSVQNLTTPDGSLIPKTKIEFRILNFQIAD